jgi:ornithine--oxo-acid transaminase/putrescine aminotransferase
MEVRGAGLLVGIELHPSDHPWLSFEALGLPELSGQPSVGMLLCHRLFRRGYLTHVAGHEWRVVRLQPSLLIEEESLLRFVLACKQEVQELADLL